MEKLLKRFEAAVRNFRAIDRWARHEYGVTRDHVTALLYRPIGVRWLIEEYLLYSTVASLFMGEMLFHRVVAVFAGYPVVLANTAILMVLNRLLIHRNHAIFVGVVMLVSMVAARHAGTPAMSILAQIIGILVFSVYYFSMLTTYGWSLPRWLRIYCQAAFLIAVWGIIDFIGRTAGILPQNAWPRLHSILPEPSFYVYLTLPAIGLYLNEHLRRGGYRLELGVFFLSYILADSSLGFLGLLLTFFFAFLPRLNLWRLFGFAVLAGGAVVALFLLSANFRLRVVDTAIGIARADLQHVNASTFAVLANAYVAIETFIHHPFIGVGIGGYLFQYGQYLSILSNDDPNVVTLNMYDAASLFFRTAAELGLFGLLFLIGFLVVCSRVKGDVHVDIRNALVPFFLMRMGRYGAWFSMDLYFFVGIYFLNYMHYRAQLRPRSPSLEPAHAV